MIDAWELITASQTDTNSPLDQPLMDALRLRGDTLFDWVGGKNYTPTDDHDHDGINSKEPVIPADSVTPTELKFTQGSWSTAINGLNSINLVAYSHFPEQKGDGTNIFVWSDLGSNGVGLSTSFQYQIWARSTLARTWSGQYHYHSASEQIIVVARNIGGSIVGIHVTEKGNENSIEFYDSNSVKIVIACEIITKNTNPDLFSKTGKSLKNSEALLEDTANHNKLKIVNGAMGAE